MVYNRPMAFVPRGGKVVEDPVVAIERGEIAPIYCLHGAERYLIDRCLAAIRAAVLGGKAAAVSEKYAGLVASGWALEEGEVQRDVDRLFGGNFWSFLEKKL